MTALQGVIQRRPHIPVRRFDLGIGGKEWPPYKGQSKRRPHIPVRQFFINNNLYIVVTKEIYNSTMRGVIRHFIPDSIVFITSLTQFRKPIFIDEESRQLFYSTIENAHRIHRFEILAHVLLPDHFHWLLSSADSDFSKVVKSVKGNFTVNYKSKNNLNYPINLWQPRYWDHLIRNEKDYINHIEYIHWNPVKHGLVREPFEWESSSFCDWVRNGYYPKNWGDKELSLHVKEMNFE